MNSLVKICFILEHFHPHVGGVETEFWEFSRRLVSIGCDVRVITSNSGGVTGERTYDGVAVWHYPWSGLFGHPCPRSADVREHVAWADVVHTTTYTAAPVARWVSKKLGKPCVLSVQECLGRRWFQLGEGLVTSALFYLFERFVISRKFDAWHCISQATAQDVIESGIPSAQVKSVLLGVDSSLYHSPPERRNPAELFHVDPSTRVFLFFGRPGKTKGVSVLLDAIRMLKDEIPKDVVFGLILGSHPAKERERYMQLVRSEGLASKVIVVPSVERARLLGYVRGAYTVITPSITEGFGFSAAETCALGTPIIASDGGSLPEVVSGKHLFFTNRSAQDLAEKIRLALMGKFEERALVEFSWDAATQNLFTLYRSLVKDSQRAMQSPINTKEQINAVG